MFQENNLHGFPLVHIHDTILSTKSFIWLDSCREALFWNTGFCILQNQGLQKSFPWITYIESKKSILKEVMDLRGKMVFSMDIWSKAR